MLIFTILLVSLPDLDPGSRELAISSLMHCVAVLTMLREILFSAVIVKHPLRTVTLDKSNSNVPVTVFYADPSLVLM